MCSFTCLELSGLRLIFFDHQNCLPMPAGNPIPAKVKLIDIIQAPPQLCLLAVLEDPGVLFALCLECLGVLLLLGVSPLFYPSKSSELKDFDRDYLQGCGLLKRNHKELVKHPRDGPLLIDQDLMQQGEGAIFRTGVISVV